MLLNDPQPAAELKARHYEYEQALVTNDVPALNEFFWDSPEVVRFGVSENLYGPAAIREFRQARAADDASREVTRLEVTTFGTNAGVVVLEFRRVLRGIERSGRQSEFWCKFPDGWKIVCAHVSLLPCGSQFMEAAAEHIGLPLPPEYAQNVAEDLHRTSSLAAFLLGFPLPESVEAAPVFHP